MQCAQEGVTGPEWEMLMTEGHRWLAGPMREIGTEMNEQTMEELVMAGMEGN